MIIPVSKPLPSSQALADILKEAFAQYAPRTFGPGKQSVMVEQSTFVGVEVTAYDHEVSVSYSPPTVLAGLFSSLSGTELGALILPIFLLGNVQSKGQQLEKEVGRFLKEKYN